MQTVQRLGGMHSGGGRPSLVGISSCRLRPHPPTTKAWTYAWLGVMASRICMRCGRVLEIKRARAPEEPGQRAAEQGQALGREAGDQLLETIHRGEGEELVAGLGRGRQQGSDTVRGFQAGADLRALRCATRPAWNALGRLRRMCLDQGWLASAALSPRGAGRGTIREGLDGA